jgi:hypothetical protein
MKFIYYQQVQRQSTIGLSPRFFLSQPRLFLLSFALYLYTHTLSLSRSLNRRSVSGRRSSLRAPSRVISAPIIQVLSLAHAIWICCMYGILKIVDTNSVLFKISFVLVVWIDLGLSSNVDGFYG